MTIIRMLAAGVVAIAGTASASPQAESPATITVGIDGARPRDASSLADAVRLARDLRATRPVRAIVITLPSGVTRLDRPITLGEADRGTVASPLVIRGQPDGSSTLSGAVPLPAGEVLALPPVPNARKEGASLPLIFQGRRQLRPTAWPADAYATGWSAQGSGGRMTLARAGALPPLGTEAVLAGFLHDDWSHEVFALRASGGRVVIDTGQDRPAQATPRLRLLNIPAALDPGRFHGLGADRYRVRRYTGGAMLERAIAPGLLVLQRTGGIRLQRIAFEKSADTPIRVSEASDVEISDCFIGLTAGYAAEVDGGERVSIRRCVIAGTGAGGVRLNGGDRPRLAAAGHVVEDSVITDIGAAKRSGVSAVDIAGVGNIVRRSRLGGAPHGAVTLDGNEHLVEANDIGFAVCETADAGAVYLGRDWTKRGNRVVGNLIHDLPGGFADAMVFGVYLDDQISGTVVADNVILRTAHGVALGGGRDTRISGNVFAGIRKSAILYDNRGATAQRAWVVDGGELRRRLEASPYRSALWRQRYPSLIALADDRSGVPRGNLAEGNTVFGAPFLWSSPVELQLSGDSNRQLAVPAPLQRQIATTSAAALYPALRTSRLATVVPGPRAELLYAARAPAALSCPTL